MSIFANAQKIKEPAKKSKAKAKDQVEVEGIELYAALCAVEKTVKAQKSLAEASIKSAILERGVKLEEDVEGLV